MYCVAGGRAPAAPLSWMAELHAVTIFVFVLVLLRSQQQ